MTAPLGQVREILCGRFIVSGDDHRTPPGDLSSSAGETLPQLLVRNAARFAARDAMREKSFGIWRSWSWAELLDEVAALARGLAELGIGRGDRVALIGDNRPRLYWSLSALQAIGAVPVPLYPDLSPPELAAAKYAEENGITPRDCSAE